MSAMMEMWFCIDQNLLGLFVSVIVIDELLILTNSKCNKCINIRSLIVRNKIAFRCR